MTNSEKELLKILADTKGYVACDGEDRAIAHDLERMKLADWKGSAWGSQFWAITDAGRAALAAPPAHEGE